MKNAFRETSINILRMFVEDPYLQEDKTSCDVQAIIDDVRRSLSQITSRLVLSLSVISLHIQIMIFAGVPLATFAALHRKESG
ncbi:MAG: hypothetical protein ACK4PK_03070 [Alphaproteobacteria bacterium]